MAMTTIKRVQSRKLWWYTVEDCYVETGDDPGTGITIKIHTAQASSGETAFSVRLEDALLIRDAINALYPPEK